MQNYNKTIALILVGALSANGMTMLAAENKEEATIQEVKVIEQKIIQQFSGLEEEIKNQTVKIGTTRDELNLPETIQAAVYTKSGMTDVTTSQMLELAVVEDVPVEWAEVTPYNGNVEGRYEFRAVVSGYNVAEEVELPVIVVNVGTSEGIYIEPLILEPLKDTYVVPEQDSGMRRSLMAASRYRLYSGVDATETNYASQLSDTSKEVYDGLSTLTSNSEEVLNISMSREVNFTHTGTKSLNDCLWEAYYSDAEFGENYTQAAIDAVARDYPEICWLDIEGMGISIVPSCNLVEGDTYKATFTVKITPKRASAYSGIANPVQAVQDKCAEIISSQVTDDMSRYEKLKAVHDYLCDNIVYDLGASRGHQAYGALIDGRCVCEGYAKAFKMLCDQMDIPCVLVSGMGVTNTGSEGHMWNYVKMEDGKWYAVDATWDDQEDHKAFIDFFLVGGNTIAENFGDKTFSEGHQADGHFVTDGKEFNYPVLSDQAYEYVAKTPGPEAPVPTYNDEGNALILPEGEYDIFLDGNSIDVDDVSEVNETGTERKIFLNDIIRGASNYTISVGKLQIRAAETETTLPGEKWTNTEEYGYRIEFIDAKIENPVIKGSTATVVLITDMPIDWEKPTGVVTSSYIFDSANLTHSNGEWIAYSDDEYEGNWCYEEKITIPSDKAVGQYNLEVNATVAKGEPYFESCGSTTVGTIENIDVREKYIVNTTTTLINAVASKITYGTDLQLKASFDGDGATYIDPTKDSVKFVITSSAGDETIDAVLTETEGTYSATASCPYSKLPVGSYSVKAVYIPDGERADIKAGTTPTTAFTVEKKKLEVGVDISGVSNRTYDGTTDVSGATVSISGQVGTEVPSINTSGVKFALAGKDVGAQKINATDIALEAVETNAVNANYELASTTAQSTDTIQINAATPVISWGSDQVCTYTGSAAILTSPDVTLVAGETYDSAVNGTMSYSYRKEGELSWLDGTPTNAGTYEVKAKLAAKGNYVEAESTGVHKLIVQKATSAKKPKEVSVGKRTATSIDCVRPTEFVDHSEMGSITLEYAIVESGNVPSEWKNEQSYTVEGTTYKGYQFKDLDAGKAYDIYVRVQENDNITASEAAKKEVSTKANLGGSISITGTTRAGESLSVDTTELLGDAAYSVTWYRGEAVVGTETSYTLQKEDIGQKVKAVLTATAASDYEGSVNAESETVEKYVLGKITKAPEVETRTTTSITVKAPTKFTDETAIDADCVIEYRLVTGGVPGEWQTEASFTGLTADTAYEVQARVKETALYQATDVSAALSVSTKKNLGGSISITGTAKYDEILTADLGSLVSDGQYEVAWYRDDVVVGTEATYHLDIQDIGKKIQLKVTAKETSDYEGTIEVETAEVEKLGKLEAPVYVAMDDRSDTFTFNGIPGQVYEYSSNDFKTTAEITAVEGETSIKVGNYKFAIGQFKVRAKATEIWDASDVISNPEAFKRKSSSSSSTPSSSTPSGSTSSNSTSSGGTGSTPSNTDTTTVAKVDVTTKAPDSIVITAVKQDEAKAILSEITKNEAYKGISKLNTMILVQPKSENEKMVKPETVTIDLSKAEIKDISKLTLVKYTKQQDNTIKVTKLGGSYNEATQEFTAYIEGDGIYDVIQDEQLLKIRLKIGDLTSQVNDRIIVSDVAPTIIDGSTYVPLRFIAENLGAEVKWNALTKTVKIMVDGQEITLKVGSGAVINEGRTLVPIRYISENLGAHVLWLQDEKEIQIVK